MKPFSSLIAAVLAFSVVATAMVPAHAAPLRTNKSVSSDTSQLVVPVHKRRRYRHRHDNSGAIIGALIGGAIIGHSISRNRHYGKRRYRSSGRYYRGGRHFRGGRHYRSGRHYRRNRHHRSRYYRNYRGSCRAGCSNR